MKKSLLSLLLLLASCSKVETSSLSTVTIVDRNGFSETISNQDRLSLYENTNFSTNQPYKEVARVYKRDGEGNVNSSVNTYHENGQPYQYLEISNGRARGAYLEWHPNGTLALEATVVEGEPELSDEARATWIFDGMASCWDDQGTLAATFPYSKGMMDGSVTYYHPDGKVWKELEYTAGNQEGTEEIYTPDGLLLQRSHYKEGLRDGDLKRFWSNGEIQSDEFYYHGKLMKGRYTDERGNELSKVEEGNGRRALLEKNTSQKHMNTGMDSLLEKWSSMMNTVSFYRDTT